MIEVQILIPLADNESRMFSELDHRVFEDYVASKSGGVTRYAGEATGTWVDAGIVYRDTHRVYAFVLRSIAQGSLVDDIAAFAKSHYRQQAVYVRYLGQVEIL